MKAQITIIIQKFPIDAQPVLTPKKDHSVEYETPVTDWSVEKEHKFLTELVKLMERFI